MVVRQTLFSNVLVVMRNVKLLVMDLIATLVRFLFFCLHSIFLQKCLRSLTLLIQLFKPNLFVKILLVRYHLTVLNFRALVRRCAAKRSRSIVPMAVVWPTKMLNVRQRARQTPYKTRATHS